VAMRTVLCASLVALAACAAEDVDESQEIRTVGAQVAAPQEEPELEVYGVSAARDVAELETYAGREISIVGRLSHIRGIHGVLVLRSGLKIYLPHLDQFLRGKDWFKWVGKPCTVTGLLHTYTRDIDGYRGPSLQLTDFSGP
jgi:hypothetical protein